VPYFHVVFSVPAQIADIAYQNKTLIYNILFKASAETMLTIAADPKHLGARIGFLSVLHTWGSHPHVHMIVPGGGISPDGERWVACRPNFLVYVGPPCILSKITLQNFPPPVSSNPCPICRAFNPPAAPAHASWAVFDRLLVYGTGGVAAVHTVLTETNIYSPILAASGTDFSSFSAPQTGWVAGGGLEYAITDHWSIKGEYLHVGLPNKTVVSGTFSPFFGNPALVNYYHTVTNEIDIGRFGINYKF
jgi:Putative transposase/Outer membrane protein beta-barrel domain